MSNATKKLTPAQIKAQAKLRKEQEEFRTNPRKLGGAIAEQIRADNHAGEDPMNYENGAMHWWQEQWGNVKARTGSFIKLTKPVMSWDDKLEFKHHDYFEVTCPTTGCIAGWADSLCGYNLVFKQTIRDWDIAQLRESDPDMTLEDYVVDYHGKDSLINVDDCYDPVEKRIRSIQDTAAELLDLNSSQKEWLFHGDRTKDEVLYALDKIAAGEDWYTTDFYDEHDYEEEYEDA